MQSDALREDATYPSSVVEARSKLLYAKFGAEALEVAERQAMGADGEEGLDIWRDVVRSLGALQGRHTRS